jgi:hypothetical protein
MAFKATLSVDGGDEIRLLHVSYALNRSVDATGRPSSEVRGGTITLEIESTDDTSILEWMMGSWTQKSGVIKFFKKAEEAKMKELKFENAYCIQYAESIDAVGDNPMTINFTISAEKISVGGASFKNPWPKNS